MSIEWFIPVTSANYEWVGESGDTLSQIRRAEVRFVASLVPQPSPPTSTPVDILGAISAMDGGLT